MNYVEKMKEYLDKDALASKLGLEVKTSTGEKLVSALALFGVGVLVGAGVTLLLAPKSRRELREDISPDVTGESFADVADGLQEPGFRPDQRTS